MKQRLNRWLNGCLNGTERCEVQLFTAQRPINRPGWWKGKFALFQMLTAGQEGGRLSQGRLTPLAAGGARAFTDRRGLHVETSQAALTVIFKLVISGLTSVHLVVLGTVSIQF